MDALPSLPDDMSLGTAAAGIDRAPEISYTSSYFIE
jgi:hypothetical protein